MQELEMITSEEWDQLFILLSEIQKTKGFGEWITSPGTFPYVVPAEIVLKTLNVIHHLGLAPVFDWTSWEEGKNLLIVETTDYNSLDTTTLCKLLTVIIRTDRFNEGYLVAQFEHGVIARIISGLQYNVGRGVNK